MFDKYIKRIEPHELDAAQPTAQTTQGLSSQDAPVGRGNRYRLCYCPLSFTCACLSRVCHPRQIFLKPAEIPFIWCIVQNKDHKVLLLYRKRSKSRSSHTDKMQRLRAEQKCDIAQREIEEIKEDKTRHEEESEKVVDTYKVWRLSDSLQVHPVLQVKLKKKANSALSFSYCMLQSLGCSSVCYNM